MQKNILRFCHSDNNFLNMFYFKIKCYIVNINVQEKEKYSVKLYRVFL